MANNNPLDKLNAKAGVDFRLGKFPRLSDLIRQHGLTKGAGIFDTKVEDWVIKTEASLNEQLRDTGKVSSGKLAG